MNSIINNAAPPLREAYLLTLPHGEDEDGVGGAGRGSLDSEAAPADRRAGGRAPLAARHTQIATPHYNPSATFALRRAISARAAAMSTACTPQIAAAAARVVYARPVPSDIDVSQALAPLHSALGERCRQGRAGAGWGAGQHERCRRR